MRIDNLPFHIGATSQPVNPGCLPSCYPFELDFDPHLRRLLQPANPELERVLRDAYEIGQAFGTPLAENQFGRPYAEDFLSFIHTAGLDPACGLEIGAGVGYLTRRLLDEGWNMTSLEPGRGYRTFWSHYGIAVIPEFFPSPKAPGPFELICGYGVLEHVPDPLTFLRAVKSHLAPGGKAVIAVPDCTSEICAGDPSILFHEHYSYFEAGSLMRLVEHAGMWARVKKSQFGRCLYAVIGTEPFDTQDSEAGVDISLVATFADRCQHFIHYARSRLCGMASTGTLGVYCAARGLPLMEPNWAIRFFDDDPAQHGKFLPPFQAVITSREHLLSDPVDQLVVMSRTFGRHIRDSLREHGYRGQIVSIEEI